VPASARGEAMGLFTSAITLGLASGAPMAGFVIDRWGPGWAFAAVGALGLGAGLLLLPFTREAGTKSPDGNRSAAKGQDPDPARRDAASAHERAGAGDRLGASERTAIPEPLITAR
jgi:predicted MFS family arabinose efflux permease